MATTQEYTNAVRTLNASALAVAEMALSVGDMNMHMEAAKLYHITSDHLCLFVGHDPRILEI